MELEGLKVGLIIVASGQGERLGTLQCKQFLRVYGKPLVFYTIERCIALFSFEKIVLVVLESYLGLCKEGLTKYGLDQDRVVLTIGGARRQDSVYQGLKVIKEDIDIILIHDGVRPFLTKEVLESVVLGAHKWGACICAIPVVDTIKEVDTEGKVVRTLPRSRLWQVQTPQGFRQDLIVSCYEKAAQDGFYANDDAELVERYGGCVKVVEGDRENLKITYPIDLKIARIKIKDMERT
jgi:2-C-methyl-D-erythritol 4-phosphate cytidylyltransferase